MPTVQGTIRDSGGDTITAKLRVTLDSPISINSTTPNTVYTERPKVFTITSGALSIVLPESATSNTTYRFELFTETTTFNYFFLDGEPYDGPVHLHTDNKYYTGELHSSDSEELTRNSTINEELISDFRAIVPNVNTVEWADLLPTGVTTDILDTTVRRIAALLANDPAYVTALRGGPVWRGVWNVNTVYQYNDAVFYTPSSYIYIAQGPGSSNPPTNATYWQKIAEGISP